MDFSYLLELAKENESSKKKEAAVSKFSTKVSSAKKIQRAQPKLAAIQAVLNRNEEEKAKQSEEFKKKRANLLALRAQDRRANQRVNAMIKRTKGANKAVLDDAKDICTDRGEAQCDEDDYGYESAMSQQIFSKLATRYKSMPEDDKLKFVKTSSASSIADIKNRVMNTLKKVEEDEMAPRKRKRKSKFSDEGDGFINDGDEYDDAPVKSEPKKSEQKVVNVNLTNYKSDKFNNFKYDRGRDKEEEEEREEERIRNEEKMKKKEKKKKACPPPMSFEELLKVAHQKQSQPLAEPKEEKIEKLREKKKEIDRPLTAKEKEEYEDEKRRKMRRMQQKSSVPKKEDDKVKQKSQKPDVNEQDKLKKTSTNDQDKLKKNPPPVKKENTSKLQQALEKPKPEPKVIDRSKYFAVPTANKPPKERAAPQFAPPKYTPTSKKPLQVQNKPPRENPVKEMKPPKSREFPPKDLKPPKSQSRDLPPKGKTRQFPPPDMRRPPQHQPAPRRGRIESDSEDEYDSEMDDFIDDGEEEMDYSREIASMFGYDRRKFQDDDDDCDDMEASYSQMQKEEKISSRIGLMEDLEDMKREEEEKKRKKIRLKQMRKGR